GVHERAPDRAARRLSRERPRRAAGFRRLQHARIDVRPSGRGTDPCVRRRRGRRLVRGVHAWCRLRFPQSLPRLAVYSLRREERPMVAVPSLWLPILASAALVFVASSVIHMVLGYHHADYGTLPAEDDVQAALRKFSLTPGDYMLPCPGSHSSARSQEF